MQKGLELPLNAIIVIAIAVLVLVAILGLFSGQFFSGSGQVDIQKLFASGCTALRFSYACDHAKVNDVTIDGTSLGYACSRKGLVDTVQCAKACGCSIADTGGGLPLSQEAGGRAGNRQSPDHVTDNVDIRIYDAGEFA